MKQSKFPKAWDDNKVQAVLAHYENQSGEDAVLEDELASNDQTKILMEVPKDLVSVVRELIARHDNRQLQHV